MPVKPPPLMAARGAGRTKEQVRGQRAAGAWLERHPGSLASPSSASEDEGKQDRPQDQEVADGAGGASRGSIAEVSVAAVDPYPWQLLLLAVTGGGASAGQKDPQHRCQGQRRRRRKLRAAATLVTCRPHASCADSLSGTLALGLHGQQPRRPPPAGNRPAVRKISRFPPPSTEAEVSFSWDFRLEFDICNPED